MAFDLLIVAGEASADIQAAHLLEELRKNWPQLRAFGVGGPRLQEQGMEVLVPAAHLNAVGVAEIFGQFRKIWRARRIIREEASRRRPRAAVLLDLPDFNLMLSQHLRRLGIPVVYYISPQVWAWRRYRVHKIRRNVERMLVLFPFEKEFYDKNGVHAQFVGHPLVEQIVACEAVRSQKEIQEAPRLALLPGSRRSELRLHGEMVRELAWKLKERYPQALLRVPLASTIAADEMRGALGDAPVEYALDSRATLNWADVGVICSGTATLEAALMGTPFTLFYRLNPSSSWILRNIVRYKRPFGMANLLHGKNVVREFLLDQATAENLFDEACRLIDDEAYRANVTRDLLGCRGLLGNPGASRRAAEQVGEVLRQKVTREAAFVPAYT